MKQFADASKSGVRLLPTVERYLLAQHLAQVNSKERRQDVIHPSEIVKSTWCPRATHYRIMLAREGKPLPQTEAFRFQRENIFYEGDRIHAKWQETLASMGVLWGRWKCLHCSSRFFAQSPSSCPRCESKAVRYIEVPLSSQAHLLSGHSDGEVRGDGPTHLIEVKSVGDGTVRVESPTLFARYTRHIDNGSYFDMKKLFQDIRKPFPTHLRQGYTYLFLRALATMQHGWPECDGIVFIYEAKSTQSVKEFYIRRNDDVIEERLQVCLDIVHALEVGQPPSCREGRRSSCAECEPYLQAVSHDGAATPREENAARQPGHAHRSRSRRDETEPGSRRSATSSTTRTAGRPHRPQRPSGDESDGGVHTLGGLLGHAVGDGRDR